MESGKCVDLHVCGKLSLQEDMKGYSVGACSPVICVKPDETSRDIMVGVCIRVMCRCQKYTLHKYGRSLICCKFRHEKEHRRNRWTHGTNTWRLKIKFLNLKKMSVL